MLCACFLTAIIMAWLAVASSQGGTTQASDQQLMSNNGNDSVPTTTVAHILITPSTQQSTQSTSTIPEESKNLSKGKQKTILENKTSKLDASKLPKIDAIPKSIPSKSTTTLQPAAGSTAAAQKQSQRSNDHVNQIAIIETKTSATSLSNSISVHFIGGIGNIMFQYASLLGLAKVLGKTPVMENSPRAHYLTHYFNMSSTAIVKKTQWQEFTATSRIYHEKCWGRYEPPGDTLFTDDNILLSGFFQSWKYFENVQTQVRQEFSFKSEHLRKARKTISAVKRKFSHDAELIGGNMTLIGIHVRRGDFLSRTGWKVPGVRYFVRAMSWMKELYPDAVFLVCSDDALWCKRNLLPLRSYRMHLADTESHMSDLALLELCKHHIVSVGSFGWWPAYLNSSPDQQVVYFKNWVGNEYKDYYDQADYFPDGWHGMVDDEGNSADL